MFENIEFWQFVCRITAVIGATVTALGTFGGWYFDRKGDQNKLVSAFWECPSELLTPQDDHERQIYRTTVTLMNGGHVPARRVRVKFLPDAGTNVVEIVVKGTMPKAPPFDPPNVVSKPISPLEVDLNESVTPGSSFDIWLRWSGPQPLSGILQVSSENNSGKRAVERIKATATFRPDNLAAMVRLEHLYGK
jgi:hypothetical protein